MKKITWKHFFGLSLLSFLAIMLELFSIFVIEVIILGFDITNYTANQRSIHCLITTLLWIIFMIIIIRFSSQHYAFPCQSNGLPALSFINKKTMSLNNWLIVFVCLIGMKVMTFIDWGTLKVIGEFQGKNIGQFIAQYIYYFAEVGLILLIVIYGQKAIETLIRKERYLPYGGIILAFTWGAFHFISRGVGIEIWNGISCIIFSILGGLIYTNTQRHIGYTYLLLAIGYLL